MNDEQLQMMSKMYNEMKQQVGNKQSLNKKLCRIEDPNCEACQ
jgi:hypothetical protein